MRRADRRELLADVHQVNPPYLARQGDVVVALKIERVDAGVPVWRCMLGPSYVFVPEHALGAQS